MKKKRILAGVLSALILGFCSVSGNEAVMKNIFTGGISASAVTTYTEGSFVYSVSGTTATLLAYTGKSPSITIPATINGYNVTISSDFYTGSAKYLTISEGIKGVGASVFQNKGFISVTLPSTLKTISMNAFYGCTSLQTINLSDTSITTIASFAFYGCTSLTTVSFPDTLTSIGTAAFKNCTSLTSMTTNQATSKLKTIYPSAFYGCTNLSSAIIPDSTKSIDDKAFAECVSLTNVTITPGERYIKDSVFYNTPYFSAAYRDRGYVKSNPCTGSQVIVSVFVNDSTCSWNDNYSIEMAQNTIYEAKNYIEAEARRWGKSVDFITAEDDPDLAFTYSYDKDINWKHPGTTLGPAKAIFSENIYAYSDEGRAEIQAKYPNSNIIYVVSTPETGDGRSFAIPKIDVCLVYRGASAASCEYAHEILHIYGAKDYYANNSTYIVTTRAKTYYPHDLFYDPAVTSIICPPQAFNVGWKDCYLREDVCML